MGNTGPDLPAGSSKLGTALILAVGCAPLLLDQVIPPLGIPLAVFVIWLLLRSQGQTLRVVGVTRPPEGWTRAVLLGIAGGILILGLGQFVYPAVRELLQVPSQDISSYESIEGNHALLALYLTVAWTTAGFGEELIFRGFLMSGIAGILGRSRGAWAAALVVSSVLFGLMHLQTGIGGVVTTGLNGAVLAGIYLVSRRSIWSAYIAHGLANSAAFLLIYTGLYRTLG